MYIDYSRLWKLLIDKNMTKTELMKETGLSSRIIAKLSKNKTVTTETLVKICSFLNADISDIMECMEEKSLSVYNYYEKFGVKTECCENYKVVKFEYKGQNYTIYAMKDTITKSTIIHCGADGTIYKEQLYPFGGIMGPSSVKTALIKPIKQKDEIVIVLFSGKPNFWGIDEGIFISSKNKNKKATSIYVMTETAFKLFEN